MSEFFGEFMNNDLPGMKPKDIVAWMNGGSQQQPKSNEPWTEARVLSNIQKISTYDPERANKMFSDLQYLKTDKNSKYYNPYAQATNKSVAALNAYGIDTSKIDNDFFDRNRYLTQYLIYNGTSNSPTKPGTKATAAQKAAYEYYQIWKSEENTIKAEKQWEDLQKELKYWTTRKDLNLSDEEVLARVNWDNYRELASMDANKYIEPNEYNRAIGYSQDAMRATIWMARQDNFSGSLEDAMINSYRGNGVQWQDDPAITAKRNKGDINTYDRYSLGMTLDEEGLYFNMPYFTEEWLNEQREPIMNGGDATAQKYYTNVYNAFQTTKKAKGELEKLNAQVDKWCSNDKLDEKTILANLDRMLGKADYSTLRKMDESLASGGELIKMTEAVPYRKQDIIAEIHNRIEARGDRDDKNKTLAKAQIPEINEYGKEMQARGWKNPQFQSPAEKMSEDIANKNAAISSDILYDDMSDVEKRHFDQQPDINAKQTAEAIYSFKKSKLPGIEAPKAEPPVEQKTEAPSNVGPVPFEQTGVVRKEIKEDPTWLLRMAQARVQEADENYKNVAIGSLKTRTSFESAQAKVESLTSTIEEIENKYGELELAHEPIPYEPQVVLDPETGVTLNFVLKEDGKYEIDPDFDRDNPAINDFLVRNNMTQEDLQTRIDNEQEALDAKAAMIRRAKEKTRVDDPFGAAQQEKFFASLPDLGILKAQQAYYQKYVDEHQSEYDKAKADLTAADKPRALLRGVVLRTGNPVASTAALDNTLDFMGGFTGYKSPDADAHGTVGGLENRFIKKGAFTDEDRAEVNAQIKKLQEIVDGTNTLANFEDTPGDYKKWMGSYVADTQAQIRLLKNFLMTKEEGYDEVAQKGFDQYWQDRSAEFEEYDTAVTTPGIGWNVMTDYEKNLFYAIYGTQGAEAAQQFYQDIEDSLIVRSKEGFQRNADARSNDYWGRKLNTILSIGLAAVEVPASAMYLMGSALHGEGNEWLRMPSYISKESFQQNIEKFHEIYKGTVWDVIIPGMAEMFYNRGRSAVVGKMFGPLLPAGSSDIVHAMPIASIAMADALDEAFEAGAEPWQAWTIAGVHFISEAWTEGIKLKNMEKALKMGSLKLSTLKDYFVSRVPDGVSEMLGESLNDLSEMWINDAVMGEKGERAQKIRAYVNAGYMPDQAELMTYVDDFSQIMHTAAISYLSSFLDIGGFAWSKMKTNLHYADQYIKLRKSGDTTTTLKEIREKDIKSLRDIQARAEKSNEEALSRDLKPFFASEREGINPARLTTEAQKGQQAEYDTDITILANASNSDKGTVTDTLAAILRTDDMNADQAMAAAEALSEILGEDTLGAMMELWQGGIVSGTNIQTLRLALQYAALTDGKCRAVMTGNAFTQGTPEAKAKYLSESVVQDMNNPTMQSAMADAVRENRIAGVEQKLMGQNDVRERLEHTQTDLAYYEAKTHIAQENLDKQRTVEKALSDKVSEAGTNMANDPSDANRLALERARNELKHQRSLREQAEQTLKNAETDEQNSRNEADRVKQEVRAEIRAQAEDAIAQEDIVRQQEAEKAALEEQERIKTEDALREASNVSRLVGERVAENFTNLSEEDQEKIVQMAMDMQSQINNDTVDSILARKNFREGIAKRFKLTAREVDTDKFNARIDRDTGELLVSKNATQSDIMYAVLVHEITHLAEGSDTYSELADAVLTIRYGDGVTYRGILDAMNRGDLTSKMARDILAKKTTYDAAKDLTGGKIHSYEDMLQEIVADTVGAVIAGDQKALDIIAQKPSLARRFIAAIRSFVRKMKGIEGEPVTKAMEIAKMLEAKVKEAEGNQGGFNQKYALPDGKNKINPLNKQHYARFMSAKNSKESFNAGFEDRPNGGKRVDLDDALVYLTKGGQIEHTIEINKPYADFAQRIIRYVSDLDNEGVDFDEARQIIEEYYGKGCARFFSHGKVLSDAEGETGAGEFTGEGTNSGRDREEVPQQGGTTIVTDDDGNALAEELPGGTVTLNTDRKFSLSSFNTQERDQVRQALYNTKNPDGTNRFTHEQVDKYIQDAMGIAAKIAGDRIRLDFEVTDPNKSMWKSNSDYGGTIDASTLCAKRLVYQGTFDAIQHLLPNTPLMPEDLIHLADVMREMGYETPCGICYVESRRRNLDNYINEWLQTFKGTENDDFIPKIEDVSTTDGLENVRKNHPETYDAFMEAMNSHGKQNNPKPVQLRTEYKGEIRNLNDKQIQKYINNGGIRLQSFSDFETPHLLDMVQVVMDIASKNMTAQAYTKVPNFAWVFGDTGVKINLSLIGKGTGVDENGNLIFDDVEGMPFEEAMKLRNRYSKNVGTVLVGMNDAHILAAMADPRIDYIIPFHSSGWTKDDMKLMHKLDGYTDYQNFQTEKDVSTGAKTTRNKGNNLKPVGQKDDYGNGYWDFSKSGKENAVTYLDICYKNGLIPVFSRFLDQDETGHYRLKADGSTDGYWKLLIDFKMYDNDGVGSSQTAVTPDINMNQAYHVLSNYSLERKQPNAPAVKMENNNTLPKAMPVVERIYDEYKDREEKFKAERAARLARGGATAFYGDMTLGNTESTEEEYFQPKQKEMYADDGHGEGYRYSLPVTDPATLDFLNEQEKNGNYTVTYRTMKLLDGKLVSPKATYVDGKLGEGAVLGEWQMATEDTKNLVRKIKDKKGNDKFLPYFDEQGVPIDENAEAYYILDEKGRKTGARYNPYMHSSNLMLNDQFSGAYEYSGDNKKLGKFVTVECIVPNSEAESGYHAQYAKDPVGWTNWKAGGVAQEVADKGGERRNVFLSRWIKPMRIVPDSEVAQHYKKLLDGTGIKVPANVVTPNLLKELEAVGVEIGPPAEKNRAKFERVTGLRYSLPDGEQNAIVVRDGVNKKTGETVDFINLMLDGKKKGETRDHNRLAKQWLGLAKSGGKGSEVLGRVRFGEPRQFTKYDENGNLTQDYIDSMIEDTQYDIGPGETKWFYPIEEIEDFRENPKQIERGGNYSQYRYSLPSDAPYMNAVERSDMAMARELLDERAKEAGYLYKGFHGTNAVFDYFDPEKLGSKNFMAPSASMGFFAAASRETAESYTGLNSMDTMALYLNPDVQSKMEEIKAAHNFDERSRQNNEAQEAFFNEYKRTHGFTESVDQPLEALTQNGLISDETVLANVRQLFEIHWNEDNLNDMLNAWNETQEAKDFEAFSQEIYNEWEQYEIQRRGYVPTVKELYIKMENPFIYDFNGEGRDTESFAARMAYAKEHGYDGCIFKNVADGADLDTIYTVFSNTQFKSADTVTYDDDGNVIPLSERFNEQKQSLRYSLPNDDILQEQVKSYLSGIRGKPDATAMPLEGQTWQDGSGPAQRQFGQGMLQESDEIDQQVKDFIKRHDGYFPDTNEEQIDRAIRWIKNNRMTDTDDGFYGSLQKVTSDGFDYRSADGQARMIATMALAVAKNDLMAQVALTDAFNRQGTDLGRALQARKLFRMMTPAGRMSALADMLRKTQAELDRKGIKIDLKFSDWVYQAAAVATQEGDFEKVYNAAATQLAEQIPANWRDKLRAWRMLSMLANPRTHIRNVLGNMLFTPAVSLKNKIAAVMELGLEHGERTKTLSPFLRSDIRAFAREQANANKALLKGEAKYNEGNLVKREQKPFKGLMQGIIDFNSDALEFEDWIFLKGHFRRAFGGWIQGNGYTVEQVKNDPILLEKAKSYAVQEAQKATYRDFSKIAALLNKASRDGGIGGFIVDAALPFKKTPANILKRGIEYSPASIMRSFTTDLYHLKQWSDYKNGKLNALPDKAISPTQWIDRLCTGLSGSAILTLGALLSRTGIISCGLDDDEDKFEKAKGAQKYAFKFNIGGQDFSYTIDWAAPMSMPFFVGAAIEQMIGKDADYDLEVLLNAFGNITEPVFNLSLLDGVNTLFKTSQFEETNTLTQIGARLISNYFTSYVPSALGAITRINDTTQRKNFVESGKGTGILGTLRYAREQVENKIPGLSRTNIPVRNIWGEPNVSSSAEAHIENLVSPGYSNPLRDDPIIDEMHRLYEITQDKAMIPEEDPPKSFSYKNNKYVLTDQQWDRYKEVRGKTAFKELTELINSEAYRDAGTTAQKQMISDVWKHADGMGRKAIVPEYDVMETPVEEIAAKSKITGLENDMMTCLNDGDYVGFDTMVEALREEGVEDTDIVSKIRGAYQNPYKDAYRMWMQTGDSKYKEQMADIVETLSATEFEDRFDFDAWEEKVNEKYGF